MKRYMDPPDNRPLNEWGLPIGKPYKEKRWDQLTHDEMRMDFEWKSDILDSLGEEVDSDTFYQDYLFRELYAGELEGEYKVLLTEYVSKKPDEKKSQTKIHKIDVEDICEYLHMNNVALSPCLFYNNWRRKNLMNYVSAFVLDIDKLRPDNLQRFFELFDEGRLLRPTFVANSGSGVHFYYLLDKMLPIDSVNNEANNLIATQIYQRLYDDVILKEKWVDAQRHWLGQDYRVVNSRTKLNEVSQIYKTGDVYSAEFFIEHYDITIDREKKYASKQMIKYADSIAKTLKLEVPDYSDAHATFEFISQNKDAAYQIREERRQRRAKQQKKAKKSKPGSWYRNTLFYMRDHTSAGHRFSAMKAIAIIAIKEDIPREVFVTDLRDLSSYWSTLKWGGDKFNTDNVGDIERFFDDGLKYRQTSSETLEEWLGYSFRRVGVKRNGRKREQHLKLARGIKNLKKQMGEDVAEGRPAGSGTAQMKVQWYRLEHPEASVTEVARVLGISRPTVYKWWDVDFSAHLRDENGRIMVNVQPSKLLSDMIIEGLKNEDKNS